MEMTPEQMGARIEELEGKLTRTQWELGRYKTRDAELVMRRAVEGPHVSGQDLWDIINELKRKHDLDDDTPDEPRDRQR